MHIGLLQAQEQTGESNMVELAKRYLSPTSFQGFENPNLRMKGTPFLAEKWQYAKLKIEEGYNSKINRYL